MHGLTIDEAIRALQRAREQVGGDAPLLMVDYLHVFRLPVGDGCVFVSDVCDDFPQGEKWGSYDPSQDIATTAQPAPV
jgi:hypothetical protein